ncbi:hypothetical protein HYV86_04860 [Candidatus Woesearchaeota archaeon]|nr:hypothetical protein [Candidatus Woesearchaeota archaeon]
MSTINPISQLLPTALSEIRGELSDYHAMSRLVPYLVHEKDAITADTLFGELDRNRPHWSRERFPYEAEAMTLLHIGYDEPERVQRWLSALTQHDDLGEMLGEKIDDVAYALERAGVMSFSFPLWRFMAQRFGDSYSLLEVVGMERLLRDSDKSKGTSTDWLGTGFIAKYRGVEVEYRRSYLRVSHPENGTLLIRNSSHFWGRDRFVHPAYFSPLDFDTQKIRDLTPAQVDEQGIFTALTSSNLWDNKRGSSASRVRYLVDALDAFEDRLSAWLFDSFTLSAHKNWKNAVVDYSTGFEFLVENLSRRLVSDKPISLPTLAFIDPDLPPWFVDAHLTIDSGVVEGLSLLSKGQDPLNDSVADFFERGIARRGKLALLSGSRGDFPLKMD